jgi:iron complex transport system ATP-binding protein
MSDHESFSDMPVELPAFETQRVSFRYNRESDSSGGEHRSWVVRNVNVKVRQGEMLGVIGPNGSGKSSFLKLLAGLIRPQEGGIQVFGEPVGTMSRASVARQIAYMPQDVSFDFPFSVTDVVLMGRYPYRAQGAWSLVGWERRADFIIAGEAMAMTDVACLADRAVGTLSAGERQRVLLARALAQQPRILLLDEPTAHLDLNHQRDVSRILTKVHGQLGMTVVLVSHDINFASQCCDRIVIMQRGQIVRLGPPHEVIHARNLREIYDCEVLVDAHPHSGRPRVTMPHNIGMR